MKTLVTLVITVLLSFAAGAAERYTYQCETDTDGAEGLCLAVPNDEQKTAAQTMQDKGRPPKDRSKMIADQPKKADETIFRASDVVSSEATTQKSGVPMTDAETEALNANITAQEKLRQVEIFLQPTKGAGGGLGTGTSDPIKAGQ